MSSIVTFQMNQAIETARESDGVARIHPSLIPRVPRLLLVVETSHGLGCAQCAEAAWSAEIHARVMGSVGATYNIDNTRTTGEFHSATVASHRD